MLRRHVLPLSGALALAGACGPAATSEPPAMPPTPTASVAAEAPPAPPAQVTAGAMPSDVEIYAELTGIPEILAAARGAVDEKTARDLPRLLGAEAGLDPQLVERLLGALVSGHIGARRFGDDLKVAGTIAFSDAQPMRDLIATGAFTDAGPFGPHGRRLKEKGGSGSTLLVWFDGPRLLLLGDEPMAQAVAAVVEGRAAGLPESARAGAASLPGGRRAVAFVAPALLDRAFDDHVSFLGPLWVSLGLTDGGFRGAYRAALAARDLDTNLPVPPPRALSLARRLPADTAGYVALSTGLPGGRDGAVKLLAQIVATGGPEADRLVSQIDAALAGAGLRLTDLIGALGDEAVLGASVRPGLETKDALEHGYAVVFVQEVADPKAAERVLKLARDKMKSAKDKVKLRPEGTGFSADLPKDPVPFLRAKISGGRLFIGLGQRDLVDRAALAVEKGKGTLGEDAAHTRALTALPANAQLRLWMDFTRLAEIGAALSPPSSKNPLDLWRHLGGRSHISSALSFTAVPEHDRVRFELDELNGVGVFAALGVYGVRRYLALSKTAEAKNTIGAIARAAAAAYEREQLGPNNGVVHKLCGSAVPVPSAVPHARKYMSSSDPDRDWNTGDDDGGWRCLRFMMSQPQYYQYTYTAGGPYKGPRRGGPDPGPNGFEVAAEGDLDGNGVTSLFTRTGTVDPKTGMVMLSPQIFVDKEME